MGQRRKTRWTTSFEPVPYSVSGGFVAHKSSSCLTPSGMSKKDSEPIDWNNRTEHTRPGRPALVETRSIVLPLDGRHTFHRG